MTMTLFDIILIVIMLISGGVALIRGFTREVLSILAWVCAAVAAYFGYPAYKSVVRNYIQPDYLADIVLIGGIFLIVLVVLSLLITRLSNWIAASGIGPLDRALGLAFGLVRGFVLVSIAFLVFIWIVPHDHYPNWIKRAQSLPAMEYTSKIIVGLLPPAMAGILPETASEPEDMGR